MMRSILKKALIVFLALGLAACAPEAAPTEERPSTNAPPMEETTAETEGSTPDTADETETPTPGAADETQTTTPLCEIDDSLLNHDLTTSGKIVFVDQNAEGAFAEVEQDGCKIGMFAPTAVYAGWAPEVQALYQQGNTIEAQGRLVSFDGRLILDLAEVRFTSTCTMSMMILPSILNIGGNQPAKITPRTTWWLEATTRIGFISTTPPTQPHRRVL